MGISRLFADKRYRSDSLASDRAVWAATTGGVMIRVLGPTSDPATRQREYFGML